jgi:tripartite-type tricarboxylate transporter receptor subunit TctC
MGSRNRRRDATILARRPTSGSDRSATKDCSALRPDGQVQVEFDNLTSSIEYIRTGKLRALAVTTASRSEVLPDIPTVAEFVPGYEASAFLGVGAPRNTPAEIIDRLNREVNRGLTDPKLKARFSDLGAMVLEGSPADFGTLIVADSEKWAKVIKFAGIRPE